MIEKLQENLQQLQNSLIVEPVFSFLIEYLSTKLKKTLLSAELEERKT